MDAHPDLAVLRFVYDRCCTVSTPDRTYSFRADVDLHRRLQHARAVIERATRGPAEERESLARVFSVTLMRTLAAGSADTDSALIRSAVEACVSAAEKVEEDRRLLHEYQAWADEDAAGASFRRGALEPGRTLWRAT